MLAGLFPRLFGQFKEGGIIHAKFVVTVSGTPIYTLKSTVPTDNFQKLSLAYDGTTGFAKLTLAGGARNIAILNIIHFNVNGGGGGTPVTKLEPMPYVAIDNTGGVVKWKWVNGATAGEAFADPVATDEVHVTLYVNK